MNTFAVLKMIFTLSTAALFISCSTESPDQTPASDEMLDPQEAQLVFGTLLVADFGRWHFKGSTDRIDDGDLRIGVREETVFNLSVTNSFFNRSSALKLHIAGGNLDCGFESSLESPYKVSEDGTDVRFLLALTPKKSNCSFIASVLDVAGATLATKDFVVSISTSDAPTPTPGSGPSGRFPDPPAEGNQCTAPIWKTIKDYYGTVTYVDAKTRVMHLDMSFAKTWLVAAVALPNPLTCSNSSYICGDIKKWKGGIGNLGGGEYYYGAICGVSVLDNNSLSVRFGKGGDALPAVGTRDVYIHWQDCGNGTYIRNACL